MYEKGKKNLNELTEINPTKRYSATQAMLHCWFNNGSNEPFIVEEQLAEKSQKFQNIISLLMFLSKIGYKKVLHDKESYYQISMNIEIKKQQDVMNNYDQLFADYLKSMTNGQKIKNSTIILTSRLKQNNDNKGPSIFQSSLIKPFRLQFSLNKNDATRIINKFTQFRF